MRNNGRCCVNRMFLEVLQQPRLCICQAREALAIPSLSFLVLWLRAIPFLACPMPPMFSPHWKGPPAGTFLEPLQGYPIQFAVTIVTFLVEVGWQTLVARLQYAMLSATEEVETMRS